MKYTDFNMYSHGFVGHLVQPDSGSDKVVIVIMGGEKEILPGTMIAERFADYGYAGLSVSLFGAKGIPAGVDRVGYDKEYRALIFPKAGHLIGMMPNRKREKLLYAAIPLVGLVYRSLMKNKAASMKALELSEREIIKLLGGKTLYESDMTLSKK